MGLLSEPLLFVLALINTFSVLFVLVYFVITLADLECDYLNAWQCCSKLNMWVGPKLKAHAFLEFLLLTHGQFVLFVVNLPMTVWLFYEYFGVPRGNMGVYDPTEIHNCGQLKRHTRDCMIHLGYYLVFFFIYLYCMIISLLKGDPINRNDADLVEL
ncbi:PREDICTED: protein cornichon homolog 4 [Dufourea novaeangliae]|uniref:Protein cornichon like protein 4 n=1 Tax=Dufourea novaeangliae TaxID=178035 RepID=A0A154PEW7_DUFNO|nr:PREDICTED: protein cornichon homolog 4 [Dufourea novaeangliae]KZC09770.1 Protein cornichon like protein 4 [Dufourea novaeangliae]